MKYSLAVIASGLFLAIYVSIYVVHINYFRVDVVFYSALLDGIMATIIAFFIINIFPILKVFSAFEKTQLAAIWLLTAYALAISVPTVIDRSLSFYILEKLDQRGGGIQVERFEAVFTKEYLYEHRLVDVRLTEQEKSGTIVIEDGCVKLTSWGRTLTKFSRYFRLNLLPKNRLLMGEYSDDLTDPFLASEGKSYDYRCEP